MSQTDTHFSFLNLADALAKRLHEGSASTSFVLSVSGPWGSGKTTLMESIIKRYPSDAFVLRYNAWSNSKRFEVWRSFFAAILHTLRIELDRKFPIENDKTKRDKEGQALEALLEESEQALYLAFNKETPGELQLDASSALKTGTKLALKFVPWGDTLRSITGLMSGGNGADPKDTPSEAPDLSASDIDNIFGVFKRSVAKQHVAKIESLEQFSKITKELVAKFASTDRRMIVAIDDIDRCLPEDSLEILEAIKLFLDLPNVCFIIASDNSIVQHGLDIRYRTKTSSDARVRADQYIEKMVDLSFSIPTPSAQGFLKFIEAELPEVDAIKSNLSLIQSALPRTPRTWKRFANRLTLKSDLLKNSPEAKERGKLDQTEIAIIAKLELLSYRWPHFIRKVSSYEQLESLELALIDALKNNPLLEVLKGITQTGSVIEEIQARTNKAVGHLKHLDDDLFEKDLFTCLSVGPIFSVKDYQVFAASVFSLDI